jgi:4-hydroxythreonine-4-phosphate dehydrogenase
VAVAALNPHGGDGGTCGREEIDIIEPGVRALQRSNWPCRPVPRPRSRRHHLPEGPRQASYQAIVTMYHDQGQVAVKLLGF